MRKNWIIVSFLSVAAAAVTSPGALSLGGALWVSHDFGSIERLLAVSGEGGANIGWEFSYIDSRPFRLFQSLRGDFSVFGSKLRNVSLRSELGLDYALLPFLFMEGAAGLGYMHSWQTQVYLALPNAGLGAGMDWAGLASIFPCVRLGLGGRIPAGRGSLDIILSYEYLFRLSPWSDWSNTHMSSIGLSLRWNPSQGGIR